MNSSLAAHPIMYQVQVVNTVTPFSLIQPLFICLTFSVSTLHQDSSTPLLTQELYAFRTLTKTFGHRSFSHAVPSVLNSLPHEIRHIQSTTYTHLFKSYLCYLNLYCRHLFLWILSFDLLWGVCVCVCVVWIVSAGALSMDLLVIAIVI